MRAAHRTGVLVLFALAGLLAGGCNRPRVAETAAEAASDPTPAPAAQGRHELTASPPVTVPDLDRLVGLGFTTDEMASEISRRGVLALPDSAECEHIRRLPRGDRLLDEMQAPKNLLTPDAAVRYGHRQAGAPNIEQWQNARRNAATQAWPQPQSNALQNQRAMADYQNRRRELAVRIDALKRKRTEMQKRGDMVMSITIEIDRLEREQTALVTPL